MLQTSQQAMIKKKKMNPAEQDSMQEHLLRTLKNTKSKLKYLKLQNLRLKEREKGNHKSLVKVYSFF